MISYLELLQMVKDGNAPELICLHLNCEKVDYQIYYDDGEFNYYGICDEKDEDENFQYYLSDTLLESQMIEKNIEILEYEEEFEDIEELKLGNGEYHSERNKLELPISMVEEELIMQVNQLIRNQKKIIGYINKGDSNE